MNTISDYEVILDNYVYNLKEFSKVHPGGSMMLNIFGGKDATIHYYMLHNHEKLRPILNKYKLRPYNNTSKYDINTILYNDIKTEIKKKIKYPYANLEWYCKSCSILIICIYLEYSNIFQGFTLVKSIFQGFMMAMVGLCIQHDANHGAISPNGYVNIFWGYTQDFIGGSALLWKHHHVLLHHAYTNNIENDPDFSIEIIRLHRYMKLMPFHKWQNIYIWFLLPLLPFSWHFKELYDLLFMKHCNEKISKMASTEAKIAICMRIFFILRFYIIPFYYNQSFYTICYMIVTLLTGGLYLGVNFIISHIFEGVYYYNVENNDKVNWCKLQIETSSSTGGRLLGFFHGGLNYQIEHHLFPRICHVHYYKIQPIIMEWCKKNDIKYSYFPNILNNIKSCYRYIEKMGNYY